jgi:DNA-binding beta-propeller fold protein YncE
MAEENNFSIMVYDRMENTPPRAAMSEPKRMIQGENTYLEYACGVYVDPATGDIYGINNDTLNWMTVFDRNAKGNAAPNRKLATPHTTFGIVGDEETQELLMTIQDDHAVVTFKKAAKDHDAPVRLLQGPKTQMADPHGIALDPKSGLIYVTNWGTLSDRRYVKATQGERALPNWPVGRNNNIPGSGRTQPASITVYRKDAQGDVAPLRVIQGPRTLLNWPTSIAVHPDRGELFVANDTGDSVTVYRTDANGDVAPIRVLKGPRSMIKNPTGVALDLVNNELWVANFGSHSATVFPVDAAGDAVPKRVIRSGPADAPSPMLGNPHTMAFDSKRDQMLVSN